MRTLRGRMLFWILSVAVPIYAVSSWMSYRAAADRLEAQAERDADELVARLAAGLDAVIRPIEGGIRTVAAALEEIDPPRELYEPRIRGILAAWPDVYGSTIAVASGAEPFAPYYFRGRDRIEYADLARHSYAYREAAWYRRAADAGHPAWSPPYFDAGGGETWMVTYSVPFFRKQNDQRPLAGVVTADLELSWVRRAAAAVEPGAAGMGWIFSPPGQTPFVAPIGATPARVAQHPAAPAEAFIREQGERLYAGGRSLSLVAAPASGEPFYLLVRNLETLDWRLMLAIPRAELLADARALLRRQLLLGAAGLAGLIAAISVVAASISRPIRALARSVGAVREQEFDFALPADARRDEIGVLTEALRRMRDALKRHIQLRAESLAAEQRLEHELAFAATIQQSMLPAQEAAALPASVQVCAALLPAKRVGGDLYDYFTVRDGGLLFAIGDVSDKGIPAALCMARLSSLLRLLGGAGGSPDQLLREVNTRFAERNEACMFATVGCGLLDMQTGRLRYASAGHEPPLLHQAGGRVLQLDAENGPAIGVETLAAYPLTERQMAPGDTVVLFTDGATEAVADDGSLFGIDRLRELLEDVPATGAPGEEVRRIVDTLTARGAGFHATDDLTVLTVTFAPPGVTATRTAQGTRWLMQTATTTEGIRQTRRWLHAVLAARETSPAQIGEAELIAEELLTNVVKAARQAGTAVQLSLACELTPDGIVITVRDDGPPFDPLARASPDLQADIAGREVGGLGIHLVRELAGACRYERSSGSNILEVRLPRPT
jgi:sigma-B regulation protein RsbU (phosphoserine phosphatase)